MKTFRKVFFFILAILPLISFILIGCTAFGALQNSELDFESIGSSLFKVSPVYITPSTTGRYVWTYYFPDGYNVTPGLLDLIFTFNTGSINANGNVMMGPLYLLQESGVLVTTPMIFASYLFCYYFVVVFIALIWDLVTFVPCKCMRIFEKGAEL